MAQVVGYVRVSTDEQDASGLGLEAQADAIRAECARRGYELVAVVTDVASGGSLKGRPALAQALDDLDAGVYDGLVCARLDRLARSQLDALTTLRRARSGGWSVVVVDLGLDLFTPAGEYAFGVLAAGAQFERALISARTREALAAARERGERLGRPVVLDQAVRERVAALRSDGLTFQQVADRLNADGVRRVSGRSWTRSSVHKVCRSVGLDETAQDARERHQARQTAAASR